MSAAVSAMMATTAVLNAQQGGSSPPRKFTKSDFYDSLFIAGCIAVFLTWVAALVGGVLWIASKFYPHLTF